MGIAWVINSTGSVQNPTGPDAAPVTRTIRVKVPVKIADPELPEPGVLEWLYSPASATALQAVKIQSPFYTRGNLLIGNGVEVRAPLYVTCVDPGVGPPPTTTLPCPSTAGNVRMENTGQVFEGATVSIGGRLTQTSPQNTVGTSANPISEAHIVNGCETSTDPWTASCQFGSVHDVFVNGPADRLMPPDPVPSPPVIDWPFWYQFGAPGPKWGCDSGTTPVFDNNGVLDNSVGVFKLLKSTSYSCKNLVGELSWDAPSRTLTVSGTVYIDGSIEVEKPAGWGAKDAARYQGKGTIYMSGSLALKNTALCAARDEDEKNDDSLCYLGTAPGSAWDPEVDALVFVAKSRGVDFGAQVTAGNNSVEVRTAEFQGVLSGEHDIYSETSSIVQGPIISFQGGLHLENTSGASFPDITFPPAGAPGNPPPPSILLEPRQFEGG
jgi:hypothetical protein